MIIFFKYINNIPDSYLERLHNKHMEVFHDRNNVLELDGNTKFKTEQNIQDEMLLKVDNFINFSKCWNLIIFIVNFIIFILVLIIIIYIKGLIFSI